MFAGEALTFSFYLTVEADGGWECKIKGTWNSRPHPGYFLFPKPERVRGPKSCMRKNLCPHSVREFPEEHEEGSRGTSSPSE